MYAFMYLLNLIGINDALAATSPQTGQQAALTSFLPMILIFFVVAYFFMIRPQSKRMKAHRKLLGDLAKGDEVTTAGGLVGRIIKIQDDFIVLSITESVEINIQKSAISMVLPKGTIKTIA